MNKMKKIIKWKPIMTFKTKKQFLKQKKYFFSKNKDLISICISLITLLVSIVTFSYINIRQLNLSVENTKLSKLNQEMNSESRPLEYELTVELKGDDANEFTFMSSEDEMGITVPLTIKSDIKRGKIRALYCIPLNDQLELKLIEVGKLRTISYHIKGSYDVIKKSPMDMFFVFIDDTDKIFFEYYCLLPDYITTDNSEVQINETVTPLKKLYFLNCETFSLNNYEIVTSDYEVKRTGDLAKKFDLMSHEELTNSYKKIIDLVNRDILYNK